MKSYLDNQTGEIISGSETSNESKRLKRVRIIHCWDCRYGQEGDIVEETDDTIKVRFKDGITRPYNIEDLEPCD